MPDAVPVRARAACRVAVLALALVVLVPAVPARAQSYDDDVLAALHRLAEAATAATQRAAAFGDRIDLAIERAAAERARMVRARERDPAIEALAEIRQLAAGRLEQDDVATVVHFGAMSQSTARVMARVKESGGEAASPITGMHLSNLYYMAGLVMRIAQGRAAEQGGDVRQHLLDLIDQAIEDVHDRRTRAAKVADGVQLDEDAEQEADAEVAGLDETEAWLRQLRQRVANGADPGAALTEAVDELPKYAGVLAPSGEPPVADPAVGLGANEQTEAPPASPPVPEGWIPGNTGTKSDYDFEHAAGWSGVRPPAAQDQVTLPLNDPDGGQKSPPAEPADPEVPSGWIRGNTGTSVDTDFARAMAMLRGGPAPNDGATTNNSADGGGGGANEAGEAGEAGKQVEDGDDTTQTSEAAETNQGGRETATNQLAGDEVDTTQTVEDAGAGVGTFGGVVDQMGDIDLIGTQPPPPDDDGGQDDDATIMLRPGATAESMLAVKDDQSQLTVLTNPFGPALTFTGRPDIFEPDLRTGTGSDIPHILDGIENGGTPDTTASDVIEHLFDAPGQQGQDVFGGFGGFGDLHGGDDIMIEQVGPMDIEGGLNKPTWELPPELRQPGFPGDPAASLAG